MNKYVLAPLFTLFALTLMGCESQEGERCDYFFKNTCKAPSTCVETEEGDVCVGSCTSFSPCAEGSSCEQVVTADDLPIGNYCIPEVIPEK